jgi:cystathionine beta-lyase
MKYNFDEIIDRTNTRSLKHDFWKRRGMPQDSVKLWIADMDFKLPGEVVDILLKRTAHGVFGYSESDDGYFTAFYNWYDKYYDWRVKEEWLVKTPGIVFALAMAVRAFTRPGDSVLIQTPVYGPFFETVLDNGRKIIANPLTPPSGASKKYSVNFEDFENKIKDAKLFLLCSPHNPSGRVWTPDELQKMGEICLKQGVIVVSDEIHSDFVWSGYNHTVFTKADKRFEENSIIATAPSKTFNLAGLQISNIVIPNPELRDKFKKEIRATGYSQLNTFGLESCEAVYNYGREWLNELKIYLEGNIKLARSIIENTPKLKFIEPEGTYLIWVDFSELNLSDKERRDLIVNRAGLWLNKGESYGADGAGYERINLATPRAVLKNALEKLREAVINYDRTKQNTKF